jgi:gamma-glutamylcyclotransferase (GGCT)/AIG2-like uncharacterized protein YtfP
MKEVTKKQFVVFVYGTLMRGFSNNKKFLSDSEFISEATTVDDHWLMLTCGHYPALVMAGEKAANSGAKIHGELYCVSPEVLTMLDVLESNGHMYQRVLIKVLPKVPKGSNTEIEAYAYLLCSKEAYHQFFKKYDISIENGVLLEDGMMRWVGKPLEESPFNNAELELDHFSVELSSWLDGNHNETIVCFGVCDTCETKNEGVLYEHDGDRLFFECSKCNPDGYRKALMS